eukprot:g10787.t1
MLRQYAPHGCPPQGTTLRSLPFLILAVNAWDGMIRSRILTRPLAAEYGAKHEELATKLVPGAGLADQILALFDRARTLGGVCHLIVNLLGALATQGSGDACERFWAKFTGCLGEVVAPSSPLLPLLDCLARSVSFLMNSTKHLRAQAATCAASACLELLRACYGSLQPAAPALRDSDPLECAPRRCRALEIEARNENARGEFGPKLSNSSYYVHAPNCQRIPKLPRLSLALSLEMEGTAARALRP